MRAVEPALETYSCVHPVTARYYIISSLSITKEMCTVSLLMIGAIVCCL